ncbi:FliM/FliN family flagellar motor switch protein [Pelagerythrobacter marinus]|uniref:FliM/FliN family flagellar motor switch protein n=1 Tax=Pelagerythrobacter marinus TaxID=538382 RepID=UPI0020371771|nr:FliM/FliN family flagellar motor C-terminal domain-containing protein [Pelagerythrobacter marinus]USA39728.1 FliM/FliN family flagellar motor C-terminal domain-containing protein [Pelagerythrobacter marinus]WPZ06141.1 FliM/FliN family flagellar motor C-terminal domain-containing protein [Pelagerythrobacter marinus]
MSKAAPSPSARRAASHCDALLSQREPIADLGPEFERFGARLCGALHSCVAELAEDAGVRIASLGSQAIEGAQLAAQCPPLAAISRHRFGVAGHVLALAVDGRAILEQLDRTFGGPGQIGEELPPALPHTARLLSRRFERKVIAAVAGELAGLEFKAEDDASPADLLAPFAPEAELTALTLAVTGSDGREWRLVLALETAALASLLPKRASARRAPVSRRKRGIDEAPFCDLPLAASARLVDMQMPLHRVAAIQPGTVLPIMVARNVPLQIGEAVIARGTVGEVDDQVALQITQTFTGQITPGKDSQ